jgi:hypothetical protein
VVRTQGRRVDSLARPRPDARLRRLMRAGSLLRSPIFSAVRSDNEALANIRETITPHLEGLYLDGLPAPEPRARIVTRSTSKRREPSTAGQRWRRRRPCRNPERRLTRGPAVSGKDRLRQGRIGLVLGHVGHRHDQLAARYTAPRPKTRQVRSWPRCCSGGTGITDNLFSYRDQARSGAYGAGSRWPCGPSPWSSS